MTSLKAEVSRLRSENGDLRRDNNTSEATKRRVEVLESKVGYVAATRLLPVIVQHGLDGRSYSREGLSEGERTQCDV